MEILRAEGIGFADNGAVVFDVDRAPETHEEWAEALGQLPLDELFGQDMADKPRLIPHKTSYSMVRREDGTKSRDEWAGDHGWHMDLTEQPDATGVVTTGIICKEADRGAPGTELLDTVALTERLDQDGFFKKHGIPDDAVMELRSMFRYSTYYREYLPAQRKLASAAGQAKIDAGVETAWRERGLNSVEELIDELDKELPARDYLLICDTWLDGFAAIFLDAGIRNYRLVDAEKVDRTPVLQALRNQYLEGDAPYKLGLVHRVGWVANRGILIPQKGTLHRAEAGNSHDRELHLAFLMEEPATLA